MKMQQGKLNAEREDGEKRRKSKTCQTALFAMAVKQSSIAHPQSWNPTDVSNNPPPLPVSVSFPRIQQEHELQFLPRWRGKRLLYCNWFYRFGRCFWQVVDPARSVDWRAASWAAGQINTEIMTSDKCDALAQSAVGSDEVAAAKVTRMSSETDWGTNTPSLSNNDFDKLTVNPNMSHKGRSSLITSVSYVKYMLHICGHKRVNTWSISMVSLKITLPHLQPYHLWQLYHLYVHERICTFKSITFSRSIYLSFSWCCCQCVS